MFSSRFLRQAADRNPINATPAHRSKLFTRRAAMRFLVSEPPSISPITAALVSVANQRTQQCPEVPSISALVTADVETGVEAQVATPTQMAKAKKSGRKQKSEVQNGTPRQRSPRSKGGIRDRKPRPSAATKQAQIGSVSVT